MLFLNLFKKFTREKRTESRERVLPHLHCTVSVTGSDQQIKVMVVDLSKSGLSFLIHGHTFEIGEAISLQIATKSSEIESLKGRVVGQQISYLPNSNDVDKAFIRYSVQFSQALTEEQWAQLREKA